MTPDAFSDLVVRLGPGVQVRPVLESVQFRVGGKAFATLGWPAQGWAVLKLSAADQAWAISVSDAVTTEPGRRRNSGVTLVRLKGVGEGVMADLLAAAWREAYRRPLHRSANASSNISVASAN